MSTVPTDIAIAQAATMRPIADVAGELGLGPDDILPYGKYKAKISAEAVKRYSPRGRLVLVTGINPTPAGEGKSTCTVGVAQALRSVRQLDGIRGNARPRYVRHRTDKAGSLAPK